MKLVLKKKIVPPDTDIKMSEVNTDLPKNDETGLEEKIDFADDTENEKKV